MSLLETPCQIVSRNTAGTAVDSYGNIVPSISGTVSTYCSLQQSQRSEPGEEGEFSVTTWNLYLPTGTAIDTSDTVTIAGRSYEVIGDPWDANEGGADVHHVEASLRRTA